MEAKDVETVQELSQRRELSPIAEPSWAGVASGRDKRSGTENIAMDVFGPGTSAKSKHGSIKLVAIESCRAKCCHALT